MFLQIFSARLANCVADAEYMVRQVVTDLGWVVLGQKVTADVAHNSAKSKSTKPRSVTTCQYVHSHERPLRHRRHRQQRRDGGVGEGDGTSMCGSCGSED